MDMLRSSRALPQPLLAQTILATTSAFVMSALSIWLVFWLFFVRPDLNVCAIWVGPSPSSASTTELFFQENDARIFGAKAVKRPESPSKVAESIRQFLESKGQRPAIARVGYRGRGCWRGLGAIPAIHVLDGDSRFSIDPEVIGSARDVGH